MPAHLCSRCRRVSEECEAIGSIGDLDWCCPDCARLLWSGEGQPEPAVTLGQSLSVLLFACVCLALFLCRLFVWR